MKKEKYYLIAIGAGTVINAILSIVLGGVVAPKVNWMSSALGVAIGTVFTDLLIITFLVSLTWKWVKKAIFNKNSLKLLIANAIILGVSLLLYNPLLKLWDLMGLSTSIAYILELIAMVAIDGIIYLVILALLKEDLVYSFIRKNKQEQI
jgi:hypothetical protein